MEKKSACFPNDDTVLTITKNLVIRGDTSLIFGSWRGYYTDSPGIYSVVKITRTDWRSTGNDYFSLYNLSHGYDTVLFNSKLYRFAGYFNYPSGYTHVDNKGLSPSGYLTIDSTRNNITINYSWYIKTIPNPDPKQLDSNIIGSRIFKGKRI